MAQVVSPSPLGGISGHLVPGLQQDQDHSLPSWWKQSYTSFPEGSLSQTSHAEAVGLSAWQPGTCWEGCLPGRDSRPLSS